MYTDGINVEGIMGKSLEWWIMVMIFVGVKALLETVKTDDKDGKRHYFCGIQ